MLRYQSEDGRFHDILDDSGSFLDGASSMMAAAAIYRGSAGGRLSSDFIAAADRIYNLMDSFIDD